MKSLLAIFFLLLLSAQTCQKVQKEITPSVFRHWIHSFEEDTTGLQLYRPASYKFPLARGREGFEVKADGTFILHRIGPSDGSEKITGTWTPAYKNTLQIRFPASEMDPYTIQIIQVNDTLLTLKKISK